MPTGSRSLRLVLITHPASGARELAHELVEEGLAACANLVPVTSIYRWEGRVATDDEVLLVVKTSAARVPDLEAFVARRHPYDVPELVAVEPKHVESTYLAWVLRSTDPGATAAASESGDGES